MSNIKIQIDKTVEWLINKVNEANAKGLIVGVSGGIDSAVVANLIKKAFPENSMGVIMSIKSNPQDREDALKVIEGCDIEYLDLDLIEPQSAILDMVVGNLKDTMIYFLQSGMLQDINEMSIKSIVITILLKAGLCILPVVIPIMIAGIVASLMQTGFLLTGEPL